MNLVAAVVLKFDNPEYGRSCSRCEHTESRFLIDGDLVGDLSTDGVRSLLCFKILRCCYTLPRALPARFYDRLVRTSVSGEKVTFARLVARGLMISYFMELVLRGTPDFSSSVLNFTKES